MYTYYLTAMMCLTNVPAECKIVWERGPIKSGLECQAQAKAVVPKPQWNKVTCWFKPVHRIRGT
jgi:hypothetical protein